MSQNSVQSMTGFASVSRKLAIGTVCCELRTLNHRYFNCDIQLPSQFTILEMELRTHLQQLLRRGQASCTLIAQLDAQQFQLNEAAVNLLVAKIDKLSSHFKIAPIEPTALLHYPKLWETTPLTSQQSKEIIDLVVETAELLITKRQSEGSKLASALLTINQKLQSLLDQLKGCGGLNIELYGERLKQRVVVANLAVDDQRWEQELFFYAQKIDISEELTRLEAHLTAMRQIMNRETEIGKQLDFLMQESNREANTIASKSQDLKQSQLALKIKTLIEQMREQIQNIL